MISVDAHTFLFFLVTLQTARAVGSAPSVGIKPYDELLYWQKTKGKERGVT